MNSHLNTNTSMLMHMASEKLGNGRMYEHMVACGSICKDTQGYTSIAYHKLACAGMRIRSGFTNTFWKKVFTNK